MRRKPGERITKRGLARAVRANDRHEFPFIHLQTDILQGGYFRQWIFICDVLQVYESHSFIAIEMMTSSISTQRIILSEERSGISCREVFIFLDVKPRASMAIARSSTSTREPNTNGPTKGTRAPTRLKKLLCVSSPRERCASMIVCALACIWGRICSVEMMTYANCPGNPRRVRSDINSLGCVLSRKTVNAETISAILVEILKANRRLSCVISRNQNLKIMVWPIGWKNACIRNRNAQAGMRKRSADGKNSFAT